MSLTIYEAFFRTVREVHASLPADRRLRVLLGDPMELKTLHGLDDSSLRPAFSPALNSKDEAKPVAGDTASMLPRFENEPLTDFTIAANREGSERRRSAHRHGRAIRQPSTSPCEPGSPCHRRSSLG